MHEDNSTEAVLMKQGYPVLISNHVDPLSRSNDFMPGIIQAMYDAGYNMVLQTKLADDISSVVSDDHKIMWAVTIDSDKDDWAKKIAPGAPIISTRLKHIENLVKKGHKVVVLMSPYMEEWFADIILFVKKLKSLGVSGIWAEPLRFSKQGYEKNVKKKDLLTEDQLQDAYSSKPRLGNLVYACENAKMPFYSSYYGPVGNILDGIQKLYPKYMPTMQEYLGNAEEGELICYDEFMEYAEPLLPKGVFNLRDYIVQNDKDDNVKNFKIPNNLQYKDLIKIMWGNIEYVGKPGFQSRFSLHSKFQFLSYVTNEKGDYGRINGKPLYILNRQGDFAVDISEYTGG
jgi:DNA repair photolyase